MFDKMSGSLATQQVKAFARRTGQRLADHHINLAVTGLSKSGKTAFITSLIHHLSEARGSTHLPFFSVCSQQRLLGVKLDKQPDVMLGRFPYQENLLDLQQTPPEWPTSTRGVSQSRVQVKYRPASGLRSVLSEHSTLTVDITDYPGEWLLDLPLLTMSYRQWCEHYWLELSDPMKGTLAQEFSQASSAIDYASPANEQMLHSVAQQYADYLHSCKDKGYHLIQPGRFVLPGELQDAPILDFFPVPQALDWDDDSVQEGSQLALLQQRFEQYKKQVIKPFYQQHFRHFDRQIVLVDCLSALNGGKDSVNDLQKSIEWMLGNFDYGQSSLIRRLFAPRIDKLVFAATKADHITVDQHPNLVSFLNSLVNEARKSMQFDGVETESTAFSAINASQQGEGEYQGKSIPVVKGVQSDGQPLTLYPGDVPASIHQLKRGTDIQFDFPAFQPPKWAPPQALPHLRMDEVMEFLFADKLR